MPNILRNLTITEVSSVDRGAGEGVKIVLMKRDTPHQPATPHLKHLRQAFGQIDYSKAAIPPRSEQPNDTDNPRVENDDGKLTAKLKEFTRLMITVDPTKSAEEHLFDLMHGRRGRALAVHLNSLAKKDELPMSTHIDIFKLHNIETVVKIAKAIIANGAAETPEPEMSEFDFSRMVMGHAKLNKRDKESDGAAFERVFADRTIQKAYAIVRDATHVKSLNYPNMMDTTPVSVGVENINDDGDIAKAVQQLQDLAAKQHRTFEQVFLDPQYVSLARRTYGRSMNSPAYSELE